MKSLLIIDDDQVFCNVLSQSIKKRGFDVRIAHSVADATNIAIDIQPEYVVLDLKMPGDSGLVMIPKLLQIDPFTRIVVLTGYASVTTAIEAIKLGAIHYLSKPVGTDEIIAAFDRQEGDTSVPIEYHFQPLDRVEAQHIIAAYHRNHSNISATARELSMHRRTLQRKLDKMPPAMLGKN